MDKEDVSGSDIDKEEEKKKEPTREVNKKFAFRRELRNMLYGFGDDKVPYDKTLELVEAIMVDYVKEFVDRCLAVGKPGKIGLEDIHYLIRRDPKKFARVKELLSMSEALKMARKQFGASKANLQI